MQDHIRKIDVQFTTRLRVSLPEWKVAVSRENALAWYRKEYSKLYDKLGRIEVMLIREYGLHNNARALSCFSKRKVEENDKATEIYLTEAELQALAEMELSGLKDQVRDIILVGCYTCQRVSNYNNI